MPYGTIGLAKPVVTIDQLALINHALKTGDIGIYN